VGYFELKIHRHILGTPETYIASCEKEHNRSPLRLADKKKDNKYRNKIIKIKKKQKNKKNNKNKQTKKKT